LYMAPRTTQIYTLSLHDALPIWSIDHQARFPGEQGRLAVSLGTERIRSLRRRELPVPRQRRARTSPFRLYHGKERCRSPPRGRRSEEHTSELQSRENLVCRLLLE